MKYTCYIYGINGKICVLTYMASWIREMQTLKSGKVVDQRASFYCMHRQRVATAMIARAIFFFLLCYWIRNYCYAKYKRLDFQTFFLYLFFFFFFVKYNVCVALAQRSQKWRYCRDDRDCVFQHILHLP